MWFHSFLLLSNLEFVSGPERPIIQVATCLTFLDKLARIENPVVSLKPEVTIRLPAHLHAWTMPDESRIAFFRRNNQKSRNGIHAVTLCGNVASTRGWTSIKLMGGLDLPWR